MRSADQLSKGGRTPIKALQDLQRKSIASPRLQRTGSVQVAVWCAMGSILLQNLGHAALAKQADRVGHLSFIGERDGLDLVH